MITIENIFGHSPDLNALQMGSRAIVIFVITLFLIRLSGRRALGMHMPFDYVISILLGSTLSGAVTGSSPFFPTIIAAAVLAILHRLFAWIGLYSDWFGKIVKGESRIIYSNGKLLRDQMKKYLISEKDLLEGIRTSVNINSLDNIKEIFIERDGKITVIKKEG